MSWLNKVFVRDNRKQTVFFKCLMRGRVRDEQQRKPFSQEQQLQEAKAREGKELVRQNQETKQKEQQTQLEKEVRSWQSTSATSSHLFCFVFLIFQYCDVTVNSNCFFPH